MMKPALIAVASALALAACSPGLEETYADVEEVMADKAKLTEVLADARRDEDRARDEFRNPGETLAFFQVEPSHTVIEYAPGGGWYTRILAPLVVDEGSYIGVGFAPEAGASIGPEFVERVREGGATFSDRQSESTGIAAEKLPFHFGNAIPDELNGTVDRVLIFRMMHNLKRWGIADGEIEALFAALKPGGMLGVVQHRAKADATDEFADGNAGYLKQAELISFLEGKGFELVDTSEINANPNDPTDHPNGVWSLPPSFAGGDEGREELAAIGESDRMTLLFKKPE